MGARAISWFIPDFYCGIRTHWDHIKKKLIWNDLEKSGDGKASFLNLLVLYLLNNIKIILLNPRNIQRQVLNMFYRI